MRNGLDARFEVCAEYRCRDPVQAQRRQLPLRALVDTRFLQVASGAEPHADLALLETQEARPVEHVVEELQVLALGVNVPRIISLLCRCLILPLNG